LAGHIGDQRRRCPEGVVLNDEISAAIEDSLARTN
jgi:hypothetical protein